MTEPIKVKIIENSDKIDWSIWFLSIAVLSLIAAMIIPFLQKKYEERKAKYGFNLYVKNRIGIIWNLLTYDNFKYTQIINAGSVNNLELTFDKIIFQFTDEYKKNKDTIHPLFAFGRLINFQNLLFTVYRIQYALNSIDLINLEEKTLQYGDKLSRKDHTKLSGLFLLIHHYKSITTFHDKFHELQSVKREIQNSNWIDIKVEKSVLENQQLLLNDLKYMKENEISINEIININKLLIQELKAYFEYDKHKRKRRIHEKLQNKRRSLATHRKDKSTLEKFT